MANFNLSYYSGKDDYSDGDATENYIYDAVSSGKNLNDIPAEEITWPVFYHLSPIRESICNWYPFKKDASILEIGAGCGAVTGVLCQNAAKVTSIELSKRRASINYERNKNYQNLDIIVGNLNDVKIDEKYDYITLIGVLEYAGRFTKGEKPFHTFLNNIKKFLKPDGAILIAIENRLGLKYFSGAPEDHTGRLFDGINGYPDYNGVRTFSKSELTKLFRECGLNNFRFYYPYPDYKLPNEIFTDNSIERNKRPYVTYDVDRYSLFWETDLDGVLQQEGAGAVFANSFFVEVRENTECDSSVQYAKLNQDRKEEFRVGTIIYDINGEKSVEKIAFHSDALVHINRIFENDSKVYGNVKALNGERKSKSIRYNYAAQKTLGDKLNELAIKGEKNEIILTLKDFFDNAFLKTVTTIYWGEEFRKVFGNHGEDQSEAKCICPANIDFSPNNVFCIDDRYVISDCEWVFDFPVPVNFVKWRAIRTLYVNVPKINRIISEADLLNVFEISLEEIELFKKWENYFIDEYVLSKGKGVPKRSSYKQIVYGVEENLKAGLEQYEQSVNNLNLELEQRENRIRELDTLVEQNERKLSELNLEVEKVNNQLISERKEIVRLKERVNNLLLRIESAHDILSILSCTKTFKLIHFYKRFKEQLVKGDWTEKRAFFCWLKNRKAGNPSMDTKYNYLLQIQAALKTGGDNAPEFMNNCESSVSLVSAKRIDIITPGHTLFLAKQIVSYLNAVGIESEIHSPDFTEYGPIPYLVICANIMPKLPPCYICYQMEQTINSRWLTDKYVDILDHAQAVLDYSRVNEDYFKRNESIKGKIYYVPMGVSNSDIGHQVNLDNQDIDVLFYGDMNCDRRKRIIGELSKFFKVHVESNLFGNDMLDVIRRSKVVLNIHYYEGALLETPRIAEILSLGTSVIVSEKSNDLEEERRFCNYIDLVDTDDVHAMRERIAFWLDNPIERINKLNENKKCIMNGRLEAKGYFDEFLSDKGIV